MQIDTAPLPVPNEYAVFRIPLKREDRMASPYAAQRR